MSLLTVLRTSSSTHKTHKNNLLQLLFQHSLYCWSRWMSHRNCAHLLTQPYCCYNTCWRMDLSYVFSWLLFILALRMWTWIVVYCCWYSLQKLWTKNEVWLPKCKHTGYERDVQYKTCWTSCRLLPVIILLEPQITKSHEKLVAASKAQRARTCKF